MKRIIDITEEDYNNIEPFLNGQTIKGGFNLFKALEIIKNGIPLDDLRAEIEGLTYYWCEVHPRSVIDDVLQIIDKYKAESEE